MRRWIRTALAVLASGVLMGWLWGEIAGEGDAKKAAPGTVRVWVAEEAGDAAAWLRRQAALWERAEGRRVYLRTARAEEIQAARAGEALGPDAVVSVNAGVPVALRGYALVVRDPEAPDVSPAPTGFLFSRSVAEPARTPEPEIDWQEVRNVLAVRDMLGALPATRESAAPRADFLAGKSDCALLTASEAAQLAAACRAAALPGQAGFLPLGAEALTPAGEAFARYLQEEAAQRMLTDSGLFSPFFRLYAGQGDALREQMETEYWGD